MENPDQIYIYQKTPGPRLHYIAGFLSDSLGLKFVITDEPAHLQPLIIYGQAPALTGIKIPDSGFLSETGIRRWEPPVEKNDTICLFPIKGDYDMPFDIFSAIFYCISRYEEYLPFEADSFGRFELKQSFSYRNNFHLEPVVDQWLILLSQILQKRFPQMKFPVKKFQYLSTIDIDSPWAFKHRTPGRNLAGLIKDALSGNLNKAAKRLRVLRNREEDPFDVYSFISYTEDLFQIKSLFFFLLANYGVIDPNHSLFTDAFENLMRRISDDHETGIHPSYQSTRDIEKLKAELSLYRSFTGKIPEKSRQHFLILKFPDTYQRLIHHGITDDYSMGYASGIGFRAGTTIPFRFYDLKAGEQTSLIIHPFTVMDVTLMQYLQMDAEQAVQSISGLIGKVRNVNGVFVSLWHNESLSEWGKWKGWRKVFTEMVKEATA